MSRTRTVVLASAAALALVVGGAAVGSAATSARSGPQGSNAGSGSSSGPSDLLDPAAFETALDAWTGEADVPDATPGPQDRRDRFRHRATGRMLHGEIVLQGRDDAPVTMAFQNGLVTAVDATSVTVKSSDGYERTWALDGTTRYIKPGKGMPGMHRMGEKAGLADVTVGATVRLGGAVTDGEATARVVGIAPATPDAASDKGSGSGSA